MKNVIIKIFLVSILTIHSYAQELKNHVEILNSLSSISAISSVNPKIRDIYSLVKDSLPKQGNLSEFSESVIVATFKLAYNYCSLAFQQEVTMAAGQRWLFLNHPIEKDVKDWTADEIEALVSDFAQIFYSKDLLDMEREQTLATLRFMISIKKDNNTLLSTVCSMFASTPDFLIKR